MTTDTAILYSLKSWESASDQREKIGLARIDHEFQFKDIADWHRVDVERVRGVYVNNFIGAGLM